MNPPPQYLVDYINVYGGISSLLVGVISIIVSAIFFIFGTIVENKTNKALSKIEEQTQTLQKISDLQISRLLDIQEKTNNSLLGSITSSINSSFESSKNSDTSI